MNAATSLRIALCFSAAVLGFGQTFTGSISGLVTDRSGSVISGASITVTDVDRNSQYKTASNQTGFYVVSPLPPGRYRVEAAAPGFKAYLLDGIPLSTQQQATVNIALELGPVSETLTVAATAQLIESGTSTLGAVVENKRIQDLPLNGRNIYSLTSLTPGVFQTKQTSGVDETFYGNHFIINGGQESTSDIILDGVSAEVNHNIPTIPAISAIPSVEGIQEFRIETNAYSAEFGRSGGGVVIMATKSGANVLHGSLFEFLRNSKMDANNFFANSSNIPLASFKRNQFGASLGGPVVLPKIYGGANKTFFFFDYEGTRLRQAQLASYSVPTDLQRAGDFSQTFNNKGQLLLLYNPFTTHPDPASPGNYIRDLFPDNKIPASMISPVAKAAQKYYPEPNNAGAPFTHQNNFIVQAAYPQPTNRYEGKIDHLIDPNNRLMGRYDIMDSVYSKPNFFQNVADPGCCEPMYQRLQNAVLDYTRVMGSSLVVDLRYGMGRVAANRVPWSTTASGVGGFDVTQLGLPASISKVADQHVFPTITIQDMTQLGPSAGDIYSMGDTTHSMIGSVSKVVGRHSLKFGVDARINFVNFGQLDEPSGSFNFYRSMTQGPNPLNPSGLSGIGYGSFLLGTGGGGSASAGYISHQIRPANANRYLAFYAQDDFKLSSRLTLNLGLRWDLESGDTERYNRQTAIDPYIRNPLSSVTGMDLRGGTLFAGSTLGRRAIRDTALNELAPRIGLAYQLTPATVVRSAYGIFYMAAPYGASRHYVGEGFQSVTNWLATLDGVTPHDLLSDPFPNGFNRFTGTANGLLTQVGSTLWDAWPAALKTPYNQQWNFTVQRQLGKTTMFEIAYAGNKGTHLPYFIPSPELNQLNPALLSMGAQLTSLVSNPFYGIITAPGILSQPMVQRGQLLRPYPQYTGFQVKNAAWGNSSYNALQARFERRFSDGFSLLASYTWSKTMSDSVDGLWNMSNSVRNWYCLRCEWAVSSYDQPQRFVVNGTYELPVGRGKRFGATVPRVVNALIGNWQVNAIVTISEGLPLYNWGLSTNTCFCFGGTQKPNATGISPSLGGSQSLTQWFNPAAFAQPAPFTFGNLGRTVTTVRSDHARNMDFSLFKSFQPRERVRIDFRVEAFNLTNTPLFNQPNLTLGSPLFGAVTSQQNNPRQIQFGLKVVF
jgi:hypothetical protein